MKTFIAALTMLALFAAAAAFVSIPEQCHASQAYTKTCSGAIRPVADWLADDRWRLRKF